MSGVLKAKIQTFRLELSGIDCVNIIFAGLRSVEERTDQDVLTLSLIVLTLMFAKTAASVPSLESDHGTQTDTAVWFHR